MQWRGFFLSADSTSKHAPQTAMALDDSSGTWLDIRNSQPETPPLQGCVLGVVQAQLPSQLAWRI